MLAGKSIPVSARGRIFPDTWDFGDGSPPVQVKSDGNVNPNAADGYAVTTHRYRKPGHYLVRVERTDEHGRKAIGRLHVRVSD
ncbi:MAG: PKD domain-containing protein [Planctomycetes bacterium]|nr:PKD domain-containing protein [Planctomycetota bacterium]